MLNNEETNLPFLAWVVQTPNLPCTKDHEKNGGVDLLALSSNNYYDSSFSEKRKE